MLGRSNLYPRSHRELALSWRRDGKTYEQIEALFGGNPWETAKQWGEVCKLVGWATGLPLANGTPCRTQVHPASGHHCWDVCLRGRSRSGAYVGLLPLLVNWGCMKRLLQCDYVCWQVQDRTMHAFGTLTTVKTEWLSCSCTGLARHKKLARPYECMPGYLGEAPPNWLFFLIWCGEWFSLPT